MSRVNLGGGLPLISYVCYSCPMRENEYNEHSDSDDLNFAETANWAWMIMGASPALALVLILILGMVIR